MEKQKEDVSLEDLVERERAALGTNTTRVTLETFLAWKKRKLKEKQDKEKKDSEKKKKDYSAGKDIGVCRGKRRGLLMDHVRDERRESRESGIVETVLQVPLLLRQQLLPDHNPITTHTLILTFVKDHIPYFQLLLSWHSCTILL